MDFLPRNKIVRQITGAMIAIWLVSACNTPVEGPDKNDETLVLSVAAGDNQSGFQTLPLPRPVVVKVTDQDGTVRPAVDLEASIVTGDGEISVTDLATDEAGLAEIEWTLGKEVSHSLRVRISEDPQNNIVINAEARYLYTRPETIDDGWETAELDTSGARAAILFNAVEAIRRGQFPEIHSMLIVKEGNLVFEDYFPGHDSQGRFIEFDRNTQHEVQSASKSFRSAMIGIAIDKGLISGVDEKLPSLLPEHSDKWVGNKAEISLENVLTMSSGLSWDESGAASGGTNNTLSQMYRLPASSWASYVWGRPMASQPGNTFVYNTGASIQLNQIVINAYGFSMQSFVRNNYSNLVESRMTPGIGYPLHATMLPRNMAKLGQVFVSGGMWKDQRIISEEWVTKSCTSKFAVSPTDGYGYQWWQKRLRSSGGIHPICYAGGNGGQFVIVVQDLDLVVVFTGGNFGSAVMNQVFPIVEDNIIPLW